jgi:6-phosphofructokinase 1
MSKRKLGILVGGGPAPGLNGVIAAATIEAINSGFDVVGIYDGYKWLARGDTSHTVPLTIEDVSRIHGQGGTILRTARINPSKDQATLDNCVRALTELGITDLICIGGDDTTYGAIRIAEATQGAIRVASVPKTIDNDLPLPDNMPTFGFETARSVGVFIVENLSEDARSTGRWFFAIAMGRTSGSLALGICKAAGATLAVIPEEFEVERISLDVIADTLVGAIIKRKASGHDDGCAVIAEGIAEQLDERDLAHLKDLPRDAYGHIRITDVGLGTLIRGAVETKLKELGLEVGIVTKDIGYELRCAKPVPFDVEYTRNLGYGAVRYLAGGGSGALIALRGGKVEPLNLSDLIDPATGRVRVRRVDTSTEAYEVARNYMTRLEREDLQEPILSKLAAVVQQSPAQFEARFGPVVRSTCDVPTNNLALAG